MKSDTFLSKVTSVIILRRFFYLVPLRLCVFASLR